MLLSNELETRGLFISSTVRVPCLLSWSATCVPMMERRVARFEAQATLTRPSVSFFCFFTAVTAPAADGDGGGGGD